MSMITTPGPSSDPTKKKAILESGGWGGRPIVVWAWLLAEWSTGIAPGRGRGEGKYWVDIGGFVLGPFEC